MTPAPARAHAAGPDHPRGGQPQSCQGRHRAPRPALPGRAASGEPGLAELDGLAEELNRLGLPSLRLAPPGEPPYVDVGLPGSMAAGERIYVTAGMFAWATGQPASPTGHPAAAAVIIAGALRGSGGSRL